MKKIYSLIFIPILVLSINANATTWTVTVSNNAFTPQNLPNVVVGDDITWVKSGSASSHTTTGPIGFIPTAAAPWDSNTFPFTYNVTAAGNYIYGCTVHGIGNMGGGFVVVLAGIIEPNVNLLTSVFPNPFNDKITFKYNGVNGIKSVEVFNMIGDKVKAMELLANETKTEIDFAGFPAGIYFFRTYNTEGTIVETRKIVKAN